MTLEGGVWCFSSRTTLHPRNIPTSLLLQNATTTLLPRVARPGFIFSPLRVVFIEFLSGDGRDKKPGELQKR